MKKKYTIFDYTNIVLLAIVSLSCVVPFLNLLAVSFSSSSAVAAGKVTFFPIDFNFASYEFILTGGKFFKALLISVERTVLGTIINLVLMVLTAYPLARSKEKLKGRGFYVVFFVTTMLIGGGLIPTYLLVSGLGLKDTIWALVLPGALPVGNMIILMNFIRELPKEMEEAAWMDGATAVQTLIYVILPVLKPALATVGLFSIVGHWNEWFSGMIYMSNPDNYPLQTYLQTLLKNFEQILTQGTSSTQDIQQVIALVNGRTGRAAQMFLGSLPILVVYPFLQKHFTKGLVLGSVKG